MLPGHLRAVAREPVRAALPHRAGAAPGGAAVRQPDRAGNVARAEIAAEQIARQRQRLEQVIEVEVRNALQAVRSSEERLDAAASAQRNASEQYESERRRFEAGLSTVFLVLERQTALVNAQARELRARADLNQAIAVLDRAVGGTLERHGVALAEPELPR
jgi:outer membrane protein TolC